MDGIFEHNITCYNLNKSTSYLYSDDHKSRANVVLSMLKEVLTEKSNSKLKLLSLACSIGVIEEKILKETGLKVYGIDGAKKSIGLAKKRGIITTVGDVTKKLPYKNDSFDFVFAGEVIEHVFDIKSYLK